MIIENIVRVAAIVVTTMVAAAVIPVAARFGTAALRFVQQRFTGLVRSLPARKEAWGTVYDSSTKRPIPFAKVQLLDEGRRVLETRIAGADGRYGFLAAPEGILAARMRFSIMPSVGGYGFPSQAPITVDRFVYGNPYHGETVTLDEKALINFDIPMDPARPAPAPLVLRSPSIALGIAVAACADAGFWLGAAVVPLSFVLMPNPFTFGTLCLFLGTASLRLFGVTVRPFGVVTDAHTGRPMPFALITLNDMAEKRVAFAVSDERGRYFIIAEKGKYGIMVFTPATVQPARRSKTVVEAKRGWITGALTV